jgi:crotonobetainyl-CoA:carnitine CoA-transferase CaiB-like acyl-CoA transferase
VSLSGSTNPLFAANCRSIGRAELASDPRFASNGKRVGHAVELNAIFSTWMSGHSLAEILAAFVAAFEREGGTIAPVYSVKQIFEDPQMRAREAIVSVPDKDFGSVRMQGVVPRFTVNPGNVASSGGSLGEHNHDYYVKQLGLSDDELAQLRERSAV